MPRKKDTDDKGEKSNSESVPEEGGERKRGRPFRPEDSTDNQEEDDGRSVGIGVPISSDEYARLKKDAERERPQEPDDPGQEDNAD